MLFVSSWVLPKNQSVWRKKHLYNKPSGGTCTLCAERLSLSSCMYCTICTVLRVTKATDHLVFTSPQFPPVALETRQVCSPVRPEGLFTAAGAFLLDLMTKTACQDVELTQADYERILSCTFFNFGCQVEVFGF